MPKINPYITFNRNCEEAFNFYRSIFGGEFIYIGRFKDMPANPDFPMPDEDKDLIMHVSLPISKDTELMGSDTSASFGKIPVSGNNFSLSIHTDSIEETERIFARLSEDGNVFMPLEKTFWGSYFGNLTDKFGIQWMVNYELDPEKN